MVQCLEMMPNLIFQQFLEVEADNQTRSVISLIKQHCEVQFDLMNWFVHTTDVNKMFVNMRRRLIIQGQDYFNLV